MSDTMSNPTDHSGPTKLDTLKKELKTAEQDAAKKKTKRNAADTKLQKSAEAYRKDRLAADEAQADYDAAKVAVEKATTALRAEQRNVA